MVAGWSCSGRTTAAARIDVDGIVVHDFDEIGVPSGANTAWRQLGMETWITQALRYQADGLDLLLAG